LSVDINGIVIILFYKDKTKQYEQLHKTHIQ